MHVWVGLRDDFCIIVKLDGFSSDDVQAIKVIKGRKWLAVERMWAIPYTVACMEELWDIICDRAQSVEIQPELVEECPFWEEKLALWKPGVTN